MTLTVCTNQLLEIEINNLHTYTRWNMDNTSDIEQEELTLKIVSKLLFFFLFLKPYHIVDPVGRNEECVNIILV